jgi:hypothetical protein
MMRIVFVIPTLALSAGALAAPVVRAPVQNAFVYQGMPTSNFQAGTFSDYNTLLCSSATSTGHDLHSLLQFDLSNVTLGAGETASLHLHSVSSPFGLNPSAAQPVEADLYALGTDWNAPSVTWNTQPAHGGAPIGSAVIDGMDKWFTFDITSQVRSWIDDPSSNHGLMMVQPVVVPASGPAVAASFDSSETANSPFLQVPEPTSLALLSVGGVLALRRRRA